MFDPGEFGPQFLVLDQGKLLVAKRWQQLFADQGLKSFQDFMSLSTGEVLAERAGRTRRRLEFQGADGWHAFYLKRHYRPGFIRRLAGAMGLVPNRSLGRGELNNIFRLKQSNLPTITVAAAGEAGPAEGSFLMTEELTGYVALHDFLEDCSTHAGKRLSIKDERELIQALADCARRFHAEGMNHHDLYLCHFFVRPERPAESLKLLDLQRVQKHRRVRRHGRVKDLAALNFSACQVGISRTNRLRFFLEYLQCPNVRRLNSDQRRLLSSVKRKSRRISRHDRRVQSRTAE